MFVRTPTEHSEGTMPETAVEASVRSKYNQIVVNPCCGPDMLKRATASSREHPTIEFLRTSGSSEHSIEQEVASILTTTTIDESVSTSSIQSFMSPIDQQEVKLSHAVPRGTSVRQRPTALPRPHRTRRRVCLLKNCRCVDHQALERSVVGPVDVDSFCQEEKPEDKAVITSILDDLDETFRFHPEKGSLSSQKNQSKSSRSLASGDTSSSSDTSGDSPLQAKVTVVARRSIKHDSDIQSLAESRSSRVSVPVDVDAFVISEEEEEEENAEDEFILDELEMSRGLVGYLDGCEPEVISRYSAIDVIRWEAEQQEDFEDQNDLDSFHDLSSPGKSKCSSDRRSNTSTFYPYSIPESAAEV